MSSGKPLGRKVGWLIQGDEQYGVRRMILTLAQAINKRGWTALLITLSEGEFAKECRELGLHVSSLQVGLAPGFHGSLSQKCVQYLQLRRFNRSVVRALTDLLHALNADAVHVLWPNLMHLAGLAASRMGIPCFWEMPNYVGSGYPFAINRRLLQSQAYRNGVVPLAISRFSASTLGDRPVRPIVFHLGVDSVQFDPDRVIPVKRSDLGLPDHAVIFGIFARLDAAKGQDRILRALLTTRWQDSRVHLVLLGGPIEGSFAASLRSIAEEANFSSHLHFLDNRPDPQRYYDMVDIAINSRIDPEPFGLSVIEAMMMARPVLVHACGGPAETVVDGVTGWHVSDPSVETFGTGIQRALQDRHRWPAMRAAARSHAMQHFTAEAQAERYATIVEAELSRRQARARLRAQPSDRPV